MKIKLENRTSHFFLFGSAALVASFGSVLAQTEFPNGVEFGTETDGSPNPIISKNHPDLSIDIPGTATTAGGTVVPGTLTIFGPEVNGTNRQEIDIDFKAGEGFSHNANGPGWYRIATQYHVANGAVSADLNKKRANALFTLRDRIQNKGHSSVTFRAGISSGDSERMGVTLLSHTRNQYVVFSELRILEGGPEDPAHLEVRLARGGLVNFSIYDNLSMHGWIPVDWISSNVTPPTGYQEHKYPLDRLFMVGDEEPRFVISRDENIELRGQLDITGEKGISLDGNSVITPLAGGGIGIGVPNLSGVHPLKISQDQQISMGGREFVDVSSVHMFRTCSNDTERETLTPTALGEPLVQLSDNTIWIGSQSLSGGLVWSPQGTIGVSTEFDLENAVDEANANPNDIVRVAIVGDVEISSGSSWVLPKNLALVGGFGKLLAPAPATDALGLMTIQGPIENPNHAHMFADEVGGQAHSRTYVGTFGGITRRPEWFGAIIDDGENDHKAIQAAADAGEWIFKVVRNENVMRMDSIHRTKFRSGKYLVGQTIDLVGRQPYFEGEQAWGPHGTEIRATAEDSNQPYKTVEIFGEVASLLGIGDRASSKVLFLIGGHGLVDVDAVDEDGDPKPIYVATWEKSFANVFKDLKIECGGFVDSAFIAEINLGEGSLFENVKISDWKHIAAGNPNQTVVKAFNGLGFRFQNCWLSSGHLNSMGLCFSGTTWSASDVTIHMGSQSPTGSCGIYTTARQTTLSGIHIEQCKHGVYLGISSAPRAASITSLDTRWTENAITIPYNPSRGNRRCTLTATNIQTQGKYTDRNDMVISPKIINDAERGVFSYGNSNIEQYQYLALYSRTFRRGFAPSEGGNIPTGQLGYIYDVVSSDPELRDKKLQNGVTAGASAPEAPVVGSSGQETVVVSSGGFIRLPQARTGRVCRIVNNGGSDLTVSAFDGSETIDSGSTTLNPEQNLTFIAISDDSWEVF